MLMVLEVGADVNTRLWLMSDEMSDLLTPRYQTRRR